MMARSATLHPRGRRYVGSLIRCDDSVESLLRRCAARSFDPCSRRGRSAAMQRRTGPSLHVNERTLYCDDSFLLDGGVQIGRFTSIADHAAPRAVLTSV